MAVTFTRHGRLTYVDPHGLDCRVGDDVLVATPHGSDVATVVWPPTTVSERVGGLADCVGRATPSDLSRAERRAERQQEIRSSARRLVREQGLPMSVVAVDYVEGGADVDRLAVVSYTAPGRVDFRGLLGPLARAAQARVELRQVGVRDAAKLQGGIGPCGRDLCCSTFLTDLGPVDVRMAKEQDLPLNPLQISGACGKLMCCLAYEHPLYVDFERSAPRLGEEVSTEDGVVHGRVVGYNVPAATIVVRETGTGRRIACPKAEVCVARRAHLERFDAAGEP